MLNFLGIFTNLFSKINYKYLIILGILIIIIFKYYQLNLTISSQSNIIESHKTEIFKLNNDIENYKKSIAILEDGFQIQSEKCKNEIKDLKNLSRKPKIIYKEKIITEYVEIKTPDNNATGVPNYLGKIGF